MAADTSSIALFYEGWRQYNSRIVEALRGLSDEQLRYRPTPTQMPIWAIAGHMAGGARVFWLCSVLGEESADSTPFAADAKTAGMTTAEWVSLYSWEDDENHPRNAAELVEALETSWRIIERCLETWTAGMLAEQIVPPNALSEYVRERGVGTRQSVLMRLLSHDAFHAGEISELLGEQGLPAIDLWEPVSRTQAP